MTTRIRYDDDPGLANFFHDDRDIRTWICNCGAPLVVTWSTSSDIEVDGPIVPETCLTNHWQVECHGGHVVLLCHEIEGVDTSGDTFEPPTTEQIVTAPGMAFIEDIAAWKMKVGR